MLAALQRLIPALGPAAMVDHGGTGATLYRAPASLPSRSLAQVRAAHRAWISPRDLGCEIASRKVPAPFAAEVQIQSGEARSAKVRSAEVQSGEVQSGAPISLVLAAIDPLRYATAAARLAVGPSPSCQVRVGLS